MTAVLETRNLVKRFGSFTAVDGVNYLVGPGEVVGLLGANGAGKTTTIRMLAGLLNPTGGQALLLGGIPDRSARRRLGYVPQGLGLYADLTVEQNLAFTAEAFGVSSSGLPSSLAGAADRLVSDIPLGLQRQLAFMGALQHAPDVLILDEPTSGVEPLGAARLWDRIRSEAEGGAGVLVSTHSMDEAIQCDRLLMMAQGRIVAEGTERQIVGDTTAVEVATDTWQEAFSVLAHSGFVVTLAGRKVRVVDASPGAVRTSLDDHDISATVTEAPATLEETMALIAQA